jgi:hypothetical protein
MWAALQLEWLDGFCSDYVSAFIRQVSGEYEHSNTKIKALLKEI